MKRRIQPFDGTPPDVAPGDPVWALNAAGRWIDASALTAPRYDHANAFGGSTRLTVSVMAGGWDHPVNWPAECVQPRPDANPPPHQPTVEAAAK